MKHVFVIETAKSIEERSEDEFGDGTSGISEHTTAILLLERIFPGSFVCSQVNQLGKEILTIPNATTRGERFTLLTNGGIPG